MTILAADYKLNGVGQTPGRRFHVPVAAATTIYEGGMVSVLIATGGLCATTTAGAVKALERGVEAAA